MNVFKRKKKEKKKGLPPLQGIGKSPARPNPLDAKQPKLDDDLTSEQLFTYHGAEQMPSAVAASKRNNKVNNRRPRRGSLVCENLKIKAFSDREIESCFDSFDLDGNGFISAAEISHCLKSLGERVTDREIDEMIKMCDRDGDGQIDLGEFAGMVHREAGIVKPRNKGHAHLSTMSLASTKKGGADRTELAKDRKRIGRLKELLEELEFASKSMKDIHHNFLLMAGDDGEGDEEKAGLVDFADFCACCKVSVTAASKELFALFEHGLFGAHRIDFRFFLIALVGAMAPSLEMKIGFAFEVFDLDGNGLIDRSELTAVVAATQLLKGQALRDRVEQIMHLADTDGSEQLDFDEFAVCCRRYQALIFPRQETLSSVYID